MRGVTAAATPAIMDSIERSGINHAHQDNVMTFWAAQQVVLCSAAYSVSSTLCQTVLGAETSDQIALFLGRTVDRPV